MSIQNLVDDLSERKIATEIGVPHDEARMRYQLFSNTVNNFDEFNQIIGDYYNKHFSECVSQGGSLKQSEASVRAKELLEEEYRKYGGDIVMAYNDARDGTNGGLRVILDKIADGLKAKSVERYIRAAFDRHVAPNSWEQQVEIIREFINFCGSYLSSSIKTDQPERYARNYQELIQSYVDALRKTSNIFRRL
jgi:hypothetical protein